MDGSVVLVRRVEMRFSNPLWPARSTKGSMKLLRSQKLNDEIKIIVEDCVDKNEGFG